MKRMNLIRVALFAVFAFMGTVSLSAQGGWTFPAQAKEIIHNELAANAAMPMPVPNGQTAADMQVYAKKGGCPDCQLRQVKLQFLKQTQIKLLEGAQDTGAAVEEVRNFLISRAMGNAVILSTIQDAYVYMQAKL